MTEKDRRNSAALVDQLKDRARALRRKVVLQAKGKGQAYAAQGLQCADLFSALFFSEIRWNPKKLDDPGRDRFLLSVGHYAIALYAVLGETGVLSDSELATYGMDGSGLTMGTEPGHVAGIEFAGGSLGQGLGVAAGLAWGLRMQGIPARVVNYMSDGELQEGATWEAAMFAANHKLSRLLNVVDINRTTADGGINMEVEPLADKYRAFGWRVEEIDGNDMGAILRALDALRDEPDRPCALICHTRIGYGSQTIMDRPFAHFVRIGEDEWDTVMGEVEVAQ